MKKALKLKNDIQKRRVYYGLLQRELAENLNCCVSTIRLAEKNKTTPNKELRERIAEFFQVSEDQIFFEEHKKEVKNVSGRKKNISKAN